MIPENPRQSLIYVSGVLVIPPNLPPACACYSLQRRQCFAPVGFAVIGMDQGHQCPQFHCFSSGRRALRCLRYKVRQQRARAPGAT